MLFVRSTLSIAILPLACQASAQHATETGSHIPRPAPAEIPDDPKITPVDRARATTVAFGTCTVMRHRKAVDQALMVPPGDEKRGPAINNLAYSECLRSGQLRMPYMVMLGAIYQALYRADFAKTQPELPAQPIDYTRDVGNSATEYLAIRSFGECVIRSDLTNSRALMLAPVASSFETAAFASLAPSFSACITPGQTIRFSKPIIAGLIAETLYRESKAASMPVTAEK